MSLGATPHRAIHVEGSRRNREEAGGLLFTQAELAAISDALAEHGEAARGPGVASAKAAADCVQLVMLTGSPPERGAELARWGRV